MGEGEEEGRREKGVDLEGGREEIRGRGLRVGLDR
jgi:hypothetical protein